MKKQYPFDIRLKVVEHYLNTNDGMKRTVHHFGIGRTAVRRWITTYRFQAEIHLLRVHGTQQT
ncbi:transposase [Salmonella enterica subsp. salamae]|nr:transposase [Salmonella enterica subsp. salamae]ECI4078168.1 transposase [Salmonella enterica subsp. salamae]EEO2383051.1 transposase [Salmonella enterica]